MLLHSVLHFVAPVIFGDAFAAWSVCLIAMPYSMAPSGRLRVVDFVMMYSGPYRLTRRHSFSIERRCTAGRALANFCAHLRDGDEAWGICGMLE